MKGLFVLLTALSGTALSGCFVGVDDRGGYADDAIFAVEWRIDGSRSPAACFDFGVDAAYVTIESVYGTEQEATVNCEEFGIDFYVLPGDYWATVELLDRSGRPISSVVETREMPLFVGDHEYVVADFPPDAFF